MNVGINIRNLICGAVLSAAFGGASAAETVAASLEQIRGSASITQAGRAISGSPGMELHVGDRAVAGANSSAVIQYRNGCRHELEANESIVIDNSGPCCLESAVTAGANEVVASIGRIQGKAMANLGSRYVTAREGLGLKVGNRAMALENSTAVIQFNNGCRYTLRDNDVLQIEASGPCCAAVIPADKVPAAAVLSDPRIIPVLVGAGVGLCALGDCGGGGGGVNRPIPPPISP